MFKRMIKSSFAVLGLSILSIHAYAMAPGPYFGVNMGPASNTASQMTAYTINYGYVCPAANGTPCAIPPGSPPSFSPLVAKPKSTMFATGILLGYQFNNYVATEAGFNYFANIRYTTTPSTCPAPAVPAPPAGGALIPNSNPCSPDGSTTIGVRSLDLVLKGSIPLQYFNIYGKIGPAYVYTNTEGSFFPPLIINNQLPGRPVTVPAKSQTKYFFKPIVAIGADYTLTQNWVADISWAHMSVGNGAGSVDYYSLGIAYHFVDKFCGQFLCDD